MRIAISTLSENPNAPSGAQGYYINLLRELSRIGREHTFYLLVSQANQHLYNSDATPNVRKIIFPHSNEKKKMRVLTEHFAFAPIVRKHKIDVLNTGVAPLLCPCKVVATMKTMHAYTNPQALSPLTRIYRRMIYHWTVRKAERIISNSESQTADLKKFLKITDEKIKLVYEALDHTLFFPIKDLSIYDAELAAYGIRRPFILFVSSLYQYKNAETLIQAFATIKQKFPEYSLAIVGFPREESYFQKLKSLVQENQLTDSVIFTGGVSHEVLAKFYKTAAVFVYPSFYETFGLTILESMACGCPVITSNTSSMPEIAGDAALLFDPNQVEDLNRNLESVLTDELMRNKLIKMGLKRAAEFTWENTAKNTLKAFLE